MGLKTSERRKENRETTDRHGGMRGCLSGVLMKQKSKGARTWMGGTQSGCLGEK